MLRIINKFFQQYTYSIYLATLIFWIGFLPLLEITGLTHLIEFIIINVLFVSAFYFFKQSEKKFQAYILVPIVVLVNFSRYFFEENLFLSQVNRLFILAFFFAITVHFISMLMKGKEVNKKVLIVSIAAYIMIGFMASILCWFTSVLYPGSYNITVDEYGPLVDFIYYSIVTMSTLGYGDILPILPQSKSLAIVITLVGQFYMAILVAFLIGKFLNQKK